MQYNKEDYVFASASVRGKEKNLLDAKGIGKMTSAKSKQEAIRVLGDLGYAAEEAARGVDGGLIDAMLSLELSKAYSHVVSILPDEHELDTLLLMYDYHNIKALIKAEMADTNPSDAIVDIGSIPIEKLSHMIRERDFVTMSFMMKSSIQYALESFAKTKDPQNIDFILDRACYLNMKAEAEATGCKFLKDYVTLLIDAINLKTFSRVREMKADWLAFNKVFLPGGMIAESLFVGGFEDDYTHFAEKLKPYHTFEDVMTKGGIQLSESGRFTELERLCDDAIMEFANRAKYVPYGLDVPAAYLIAKEGEIRLVRIILAAIDQGLSSEQLSSRLRRTYV